MMSFLGRIINLDELFDFPNERTFIGQNSNVSFCVLHFYFEYVLMGKRAQFVLFAYAYAYYPAHF